VATGFQKHHGSDREKTGDAVQQRPNMTIAPNPASLEVWKLDLPFDDIAKKFVESRLC
jgi:hypothetical protein